MKPNSIAHPGVFTPSRPGRIDQPSRLQQGQPAARQLPARLLVKDTPVTKRPSLLKAITQPAEYKKALNQHKVERHQKHYDLLLHALSQTPADPDQVKKHFKKLSASGARALHSYAQPVPADEQGKTALKQRNAQVQQGIDGVLDYLPPKSPVHRHLKLLDVLLSVQSARIDKAAQYARDADAACTELAAALTLDADASPKKQVYVPSKDGASGAIFTGSRNRRATLAIGKHEAPQALRGSNSAAQDRATANAGSDSEESVVFDEEESDAQALVLNPPPGSQGFKPAQPARKEFTLHKLFKVEQDPEVPKAALRIYKVLDHLARHAPQDLAFGFGHHVVLDPAPHERAALIAEFEVSKAHADPARLPKVEKQIAAAATQPVLVQNFLGGKLATQAPFEERLALVTEPKSCRAMGASLVTAPLTGLGDHLSLDGCGFNNWTNVMVDNNSLSMIDLSPRDQGLTDDSINAMKALVTGLKSLAKKVGANGELPTNWYDHLKGQISDFRKMTYSADGGLFNDDDFLTPDELREKRAIEQNDAMDPTEKKNALNALENRAIAKTRAVLVPVRAMAAPHLIRGLVEGIAWTENNATALLEAHEASVGDDATQRAGLARGQMIQIQEAFAQLTPAERHTLSHLKPPADPALAALKA